MENTDLKYLHASTLQQKLKEVVYGKVFVKVIDDVLVIRIECYHDINFKTTIENFSDKVLNGYATDQACCEVSKQYRTFINKTYFK